MPPAWTPGVERAGGLDPSKENSRNRLCTRDSFLAGQGPAGSCSAHSVCLGFTSVLEWGAVTRWRRTSENAQVIDTLLSTEMLRRQCWLFAIGSSLFAIGMAPGFAMVGGAGATNLLCFIGSWFFTSAALVQLLLSRPSKSRSWAKPSIRAESYRRQRSSSAPCASMSAPVQRCGRIEYLPASTSCGGRTRRVRSHSSSAGHWGLWQ